MSTTITTSPQAGTALVDSQALTLWQAIAAYQTRQTAWLINGLAEKGFADLTSTHVAFIAALDCADNMASEIARRLNISRQAVHKTVRELTALGYVTTAQNPALRNSKVIQITEQGEHLIAAARHMFAELDNALTAKIDAADLQKLLDVLTDRPSEQD
ncbi:MarR family winged helix-turn-helix transcriptional regulator [Yoonia sp. BS5-3]|uniref:MarR family winged helix-turn-helix transcriptional regulator n=1 Tax=Yoonia phaeophyticola TaxID=3137369 RepID=A0ABZ2V0C6_9RHOB